MGYSSKLLDLLPSERRFLFRLARTRGDLAVSMATSEHHVPGREAVCRGKLEDRSTCRVRGGRDGLGALAAGGSRVEDPEDGSFRIRLCTVRSLRSRGTSSRTCCSFPGSDIGNF